jgi:hypothetical protein
MTCTRGPFQPPSKVLVFVITMPSPEPGVGHEARRAFLGVLGGAVAWPLAARGQTSAKIPRIGLLWHEASTEEAVIYLGADLSCRQNATHSRDIDWLLNHPLGRPCP